MNITKNNLYILNKPESTYYDIYFEGLIYLGYAFQSHNSTFWYLQGETFIDFELKAKDSYASLEEVLDWIVARLNAIMELNDSNVLPYQQFTMARTFQ